MRRTCFTTAVQQGRIEGRVIAWALASPGVFSRTARVVSTRLPRSAPHAYRTVMFVTTCVPSAGLRTSSRS